MDYKKIGRVFYRDGYRLANNYLGNELTPSSVSGAIIQLHKAIDDLMASFLRRVEAEGKPAECRKGCSWCCHQAVYAVTHEFFHIRDHVRKHFTVEIQQRIMERARSRSQPALNRPGPEKLRYSTPCQFLEEDSCMIYEVRPMACRIYLSSSEQSCRMNKEQPESKTGFPELYEFPLKAGRMMNEGFVAFLKQIGMQSAELTIEGGYCSLSAADQTFESWIQGSSSSP